MNKEVKELSVKILQLGEGLDAAVVMTAIGMAAASAVTFARPHQKEHLRQFFLDKFNEACRDLDQQ